MKKLLTSIWNWIKSIFTSKKETEEPVVEKTKEEILFEKLKDSGFFEEDESNTDEAKARDLAESARKLNDYKDQQSQTTELPEEFKSAALNESAKDRTTLIRQDITLRDVEENKKVAELKKEQKAKESVMFQTLASAMKGSKKEELESNNEEDK